MPSFFRKQKSPSQASILVDAAHDSLGRPPAFPPHHDSNNNNNSRPDSRLHHHYQHHQQQHQSESDEYHLERRFSEQPLAGFDTPEPQSPHRSQSQRQQQEQKQPTIALVNPTEPPTVLLKPRTKGDPQRQDLEPTSSSSASSGKTKSKRNIFQLHSSSHKDKDRDREGFLERNRSLKRSTSSRRSARPGNSLAVETSPRTQDLSSSATVSPNSSVAGRLEHVVVNNQSTVSLVSQIQQAPEPPSAGFSSPKGTQSFSWDPPPRVSSVQRSNTDPTVLEGYLRHHTDARPDAVRPGSQQQQQQQQHSTYPAPAPGQSYRHRQYTQLDPGRPASQHSLEPSSPAPPGYSYSDRRYKDPGAPVTPIMTAPSDRPTGMRPPQPDQTGQTQGSHSLYLQGHHPDTGSKPNASQQSIKDSASSTPPPGKGRDDLSEIDVRALAQKQEELQSKYSKVKRLYYEKDAQVQHLQNTIAHQRMAVSRTVLDDNEYTNRFSRLEGAIKELAFSIRKEWTDIPTWLQAHVNSDAQGKEMTAVGRAVISRWLVDEIFQRYFHPALDPTFSMQLKTIELNLRRQQGNKAYTDEDKENAVARISNWRCTTLDGLAEALQGAPAEEHRAQLIHYLAEKLVASLAMHLVTPPPPELDNAALMIVENSMNIAEKIPLESRDICVEYFLPGTPVSERSMKVETGLPPLTTAVQPADPAAGDATLQDDGASPATELERGRNSSENSAQSQGTTSAPTVPVKEGKKKSVFGSLIGGGGSSSGGGSLKKNPPPSAPPAEQPPATARPSSALAKDKERDEADSGTERVRLATFVHVEVRGRGPTNVLAKTPVYV